MAKAARAVKSESILTTDWLRNHVLKVLFFLSLLLYANTIPNEYCLDDELVTQNHRLTAKGISAIPEILEEPYYKDEMGYSYGYRPVTLIFFAITHELWGENPHAEHLVNALLYACLVVVFFIFLRIVFPNLEFWPLFFAAVFFTVYPPHTEVVASLKNRDELLSFLGGLAAGVFLFNDSLNPLKAAVLAVAAFAFGVYSKNSIILFPILYGGFYLLSKRQPDARLLIFSIPASLLSALQLEGFKAFEWYLFFSVSLISCCLPYYRSIIQYLTGLSRSSFFSNTEVRSLSEEIPVDSVVGIKIEEKHFLLLLIWVVSWIVFPLPSATLLFYVLCAVYIRYFSLYSQSWLPAMIYCSWLLLNQSVSFSEETHNLLNMGFLLMQAWNLQKPASVRAWMCQLILFAVLWNTSDYTSFSQFLEFAIPELIFWLVLFVPASNVLRLLTGLLLLTWFYDLFDPRVFSWKQRVFFYSEGFFGLLLFMVALKKLESRLLLKAITGIVLMTLPFGLIGSLGSVSELSRYNDLKEIRSAAEQLPAPPVNVVSNRPLNAIEVPLDFQVQSDTLVATSAYIVSEYIYRLFIPWPMVCYYGYKAIVPVALTDGHAWVGFVYIFILFALFVYSVWKENTALGLGIFWLSLALLPYSNLVGRIPGMIADRYLLIPSAAFALIIAGILSHSFRYKLIRPAFWIALFLLYTLPVAALTILRNADWANHLSLLKADIQKVPESAQLNNLLASHLIIQANTLPAGEQQNAIRREAESFFGKAIEIYPYFFNTWYDLGRTRFLLEDWSSALAAFNQAEKLNPDFPELKEYTAKCMCKIGLRSEQKGDFSAAMIWYEKAIEEDPFCEMAYNSKAFLYFRQQKPAEAAGCLRQGLKEVPTSFDLNANLGKVYMQLQMKDSALMWFNNALKLRPGDTGLQRVIGTLESNPQP